MVAMKVEVEVVRLKDLSHLKDHTQGASARQMSGQKPQWVDCQRVEEEVDVALGHCFLHHPGVEAPQAALVSRDSSLSLFQSYSLRRATAVSWSLQISFSLKPVQTVVQLSRVSPEEHCDAPADSNSDWAINELRTRVRTTWQCLVWINVNSIAIQTSWTVLLTERLHNFGASRKHPHPAERPRNHRPASQ